MTNIRFLYILLISNFIHYASECSRIQSLTINRFSKCPNDEKNSAHFNGFITKITENAYVINGNFTVTQIVTNPFTVSTVHICIL